MSSEAEVNLDEFLSLLEGDSEPSEPTTQENALNSPPRKELKDLTYEDVFGSPSPEKKKRKTDENESRRLGRTTSAATGSNECWFRSTANSRNTFYEVGAPMKPALVKTPNLYAGLDTNQLVIDHHSRIRVYKTSITLYHDETIKPEAVLKERNLGMQYVGLLSFNLWYRTKKGTVEEKNFWTSAVLTRKLPGVRKSSKGNEYVVWEINDLKELEKCWTVFLFGSAATSTNLSAIPIGSLIDLTTPSVMDSSNGSLKFSVNNANQIRLIATAKDFGICQSKRKDGKDCTAVVNTWECCVCIHHASSELRKINSKNPKSKAFVSNKNVNHSKLSEGPFLADLKKEGVVTINFGSSKNGKCQNSAPIPVVSSIPSHVKKGSTRMELQGSSICGELKRNTASTGNSNNISFKAEERDQLLIKEPALPVYVRKPVDLNPEKTRHLTDKDRMILAALGGPSSTNKTEEGKKKIENKSSNNFNPELVSRMASSPSVGGMNFLRYLGSQGKSSGDNNNPLDIRKPEAQPIVMNRKTIQSMKKALELVKTKGPIRKADPNAMPKRKSVPVNFKEGGESSSRPSTSRKRGIEVEFDFESEDFKKILNAKSAHEDHLADVQQEEYFDKLGKKEAIEKKLLSTYSIATNAVMCKQCKYVALGQSDFCKELGHQIRIVKATKRFFKCKDCGNRAMSLDRLPKHPCKICHSSSWLAAPVGKEKQGPVLASEVLSIRGNEEKFIGSAGSKMFINLEVAN